MKFTEDTGKSSFTANIARKLEMQPGSPNGITWKLYCKARENKHNFFRPESGNAQSWHYPTEQKLISKSSSCSRAGLRNGEGIAGVCWLLTTQHKHPRAAG